MLCFFQNLEIWSFGKFLKFFCLDLEKKTTVLDWFLSYLTQMIISMRGCVAYNDPWQWPISSKSFDLDFENHVHSVMFSVLDRLFPHLPQIITTIKGCVVCKVYNKTLNFNFSQFFLIFRLSHWKKSTILLAFFPYLPEVIISIRGCVACNDLDLYFQGHSALTLKIVSAL